MRRTFPGFSYGFRPGRSAHDAPDSLSAGIATKKANRIPDAGIKGFFDNISHEKRMEPIGLRIADRRILRPVGKWPTAGVAEAGQWPETKAGTPQGAAISPLAANIRLHYVPDQRAMERRKEEAACDAISVRYADDFVPGFQYRKEAERFLERWRKRLADYGLELHSEKTRPTEFGRFAEGNRKREGAGKPETFNFPGFPHIRSTIHSSGKFTVMRKTVGKRVTAKLREIADKPSKRMNAPIGQTGTGLSRVVRGYYNYHAIPGNLKRLCLFRREAARHWLSTPRRRSQRSRWTWERFETLLDQYPPEPRITHPHPPDRFYAKHPDQSRVR